MINYEAAFHVLRGCVFFPACDLCRFLAEMESRMIVSKELKVANGIVIITQT